MDLKIGYPGGSGGFLLLHLLLLSDRYHVEFRQNKTFDAVFEQQWKISNHRQWKDLETWPDNDKTYSSQTSRNKIYFFCNPWEKVEWNDCPGSALTLYTDFFSQTVLAHYKRAGWYRDKIMPARDFKFSAYKELLKNWQNHYNNIKEQDWPACLSFRDIDKLPQYVQQEVLDNPYTDYYLNYQYIEPAKKYQDHWVIDLAIPVLDNSDFVVRLQDLVNSNGSILSDLLAIPAMNIRQLQFLQTWKQLHPPELLDKIGIR